MQVRSHLPKALQNSLTVKAGELTLRMPDDLAGAFETACSIVTAALVGLESRPVIPREIEDILGISSSERRRWLEDGRLPSAGTRTVELRGRGTITFHVFDPQFVADVASRDLVVEWRESDAEAAAERRRQGSWKAKQKRHKGAGDVSERRTEGPLEDGDDSPGLIGWEEFVKTGLP